jgi:hypothetical protein
LLKKISVIIGGKTMTSGATINSSATILIEGATILGVGTVKQVEKMTVKRKQLAIVCGCND